jgi:cell division septal protein FtsQ
VLVTLLALGISALYYTPGYLSSNQSQIIVKGNKVVSAAQVKAALKTVSKYPLYQLNPRELEDQVTKLSMVKHAFVRRYCLPSPKLIVEVMEEFPWASYATNADDAPQWVIAESGRVISIAEFPSVIQPHLKILAQPNFRLSSSQVGQWANWLGYIEKETGKQVNAVDFTQPKDIKVISQDYCIKLGSADGSLTKRLYRLASVLSAIKPTINRLEYINLSLDNNIPLKLAKENSKQPTHSSF